MFVSHKCNKLSWVVSPPTTVWETHCIRATVGSSALRGGRGSWHWTTGVFGAVWGWITCKKGVSLSGLCKSTTEPQLIISVCLYLLHYITALFPWILSWIWWPLEVDEHQNLAMEYRNLSHQCANIQKKIMTDILMNATQKLVSCTKTVCLFVPRVNFDQIFTPLTPLPGAVMGWLPSVSGFLFSQVVSFKFSCKHTQDA